MSDSSDADVEQGSRQFTLRGLCAVTFIVAWILAVNRWLGPPYGSLTAMPLSILAVLVVVARQQILIGAILGALLLSFIGIAFLIQWDPADPRYAKSLLLLAAGGCATGGSINALAVRRWLLGGLSLLGSIAIWVWLFTLP